MVQDILVFKSYFAVFVLVSCVYCILDCKSGDPWRPVKTETR